MHPDKAKTSHRRRLWTGFGIGVSVSLLAYLGVAGLLNLIRQFQLPEEELAIFTSIFYGIVFFLALGGVRTESRRYKQLVSRNPYGAPAPPVSESRQALNRIRAALWYIFSFFSLGWLTPALVIYWADPKHPHWAVSVCAYVFSLAAGTGYVLKRSANIHTGRDYVIFYAGLLLGAVMVNRIALTAFV